MALPLSARAASRLGAVDRRRCLHHLLGLGAVGLGGCATRASDPATRTMPVASTIAPFSTAALGTALPPGWQPYVLRRDKPPTRYTIVPDADRRVLHARSSGAATGLRCPVHIDPRAHPLLRFSWRVQQVPPQARVDAAESDDAPARVVIAFGGDEARLSVRERLFYDQVELFTGQRLPFATLMYVWDGALDHGAVVHNHRTSRIRYVTVQSGAAQAGRWLHYERDVVADYQRVYGESPGPVLSVGVLTDSDALKHEAQAWYGDITLGPRGA